MLIGISLFLYQCQKVDDNQIIQPEQKLPLKISIVNGNAHFEKTNPKIYNKLKQVSQSNVLSRETAYSDDYDFYFNLDNIQIIEKTSYTQYTVVVERDTDSNDLLNYMLIIYNDGEEYQYLITYPKIETPEGLEIDHFSATMQSLNGQSLLARGQPNCPDGQPQFIGMDSVYGCSSFCTGTNNHALGEECEWNFI